MTRREYVDDIIKEIDDVCEYQTFSVNEIYRTYVGLHVKPIIQFSSITNPNLNSLSHTELRDILIKWLLEIDDEKFQEFCKTECFSCEGKAKKFCLVQ